MNNKNDLINSIFKVSNSENISTLIRMSEGKNSLLYLLYVSKEELIKAKENPSEHRNLRVRVSGFSDYFVKLNEGLQDDIINRTEQGGF